MNVFPIIQKIFDDNNINYSIVKRERQIKVEMPAREIVFCDIVQKLSATFENPKYIDHYYGYIWSANQKFISFNILETGYQTEEMYVYIFKKLPLSKRIAYTDYSHLNAIITNILEKHYYTCDNFIHYCFPGNKYQYFGHGTNHECILTLKRNQLTFSLFEKQSFSETTYRLIPILYKKFKVNISNLDTIQQTLSVCFSLLKNSET